MSEPQVRRFPFWLTLSVLGNLVLIGLLAGIFLNAPPKPGKDWRPNGPGPELSAGDREAVRELMRESFEAGREAMQVRREAERNLADTLKAEPYDEDAARAALAELREADRIARAIVADRMFEGLDELSPEQRALVAKIMSGNLEKRGKRGERLEKWRERREEMREGGEPPR
jgi:uncharacterized membrane protein